MAYDYDRNDTQLRKKILRLAYENPELRKHLLPLVKEATVKSLEQELVKQVETTFPQGPKDRMTGKLRSLWFSGVEVLIYETNNRGTVINIEGKEYKSAAEAARALLRHR
jgi:hypothetical protein